VASPHERCAGFHLDHHLFGCTRDFVIRMGTTILIYPVIQFDFEVVLGNVPAMRKVESTHETVNPSIDTLSYKLSCSLAVFVHFIYGAA